MYLLILRETPTARHIVSGIVLLSSLSIQKDELQSLKISYLSLPTRHISVTGVVGKRKLSTSAEVHSHSFFVLYFNVCSQQHTQKNIKSFIMKKVHLYQQSEISFLIHEIYNLQCIAQRIFSLLYFAGIANDFAWIATDLFSTHSW